jgi:hypothetical protein
LPSGRLRPVFTDCVGAVTARDGSAEAVFGLDVDFAVLGFALEP